MFEVLIEVFFLLFMHFYRFFADGLMEELGPNVWEDDLNRQVDFGLLIGPASEMVNDT